MTTKAGYETMPVPKASVVILTKNAGASFRRTLEALRRQETDWPYEVLAVDSGSTDGTLEMLAEFSVRIHRIEPQSFNFGATRDLGFSLAHGSHIVTISQDVVPAGAAWLARICKPFEDPIVAAVMGSCEPPAGADVFFWERMNLFYFSSDCTRWMATHGCGLSFANCAVRRAFWDDHRIGATPFSEDKRFQIEIEKAGKRIVVAPDALAWHGHQYGLRSLVTRLIGEGVGWRHAGELYTARDCVRDIVKHRWLCRLSVTEFAKGTIRSPAELLFPLIRPVCVYLGNRRARADEAR